jgi:hypothetical protein
MMMMMMMDEMKGWLLVVGVVGCWMDSFDDDVAVAQ